jgi:hypothetical protein
MTDTTRRALLGATACALPVASFPAVLAASEAEPSEAFSYAAIRERVALVVATFTRATFGNPQPMTPEEAAAALAFTDDDFEFPMSGPVVPLALRWGVSLDWLLFGDMGALLHYARAGFTTNREPGGTS